MPTLLQQPKKTPKMHTQLFVSLAASVMLLVSTCQFTFSQIPDDSGPNAQTTNVMLQSGSWDEAGYSEQSSIRTDGNLVVSNSNGAVSYTYPVGTQPLTGKHSLSVTMTYNGGLGVTALAKYNSLSSTYDPEPDVGQTVSLVEGYRKLTRQRPGWILGVNGFAVSVLSTKGWWRYDEEFFTDPNNSTYEYAPTRTPFLIDGFDFCNNFISTHDGSAVNVSYTNTIRLLRSDGSLLQLHRQVPDTEKGDATGHTGLFHEIGANAVGYAFVEYDKKPIWSRWQEQYEEGSNGNPDYDSYPEMFARIVHYFPGDGLEYVFKEYKTPFGALQAKLGSESNASDEVTPSVFYLDRIVSQNRVEAVFSRTKHVGEDAHIPGRAALASVGEFTFQYSDNGLIVKQNDRRTLFRIDDWVVNGSKRALPSPSYSWSVYSGDIRANAHSSKPFTYDDSYGLITSIEDSEGRLTEFTYEEYQRTYKDYGFPRSKRPVGEPHVTLELTDHRLATISSNKAVYEIEYYGAKSATFTQEDLNLLYPSTLGEPGAQFLLSNMVEKLTTRHPYNTLGTNPGEIHDHVAESRSYYKYYYDSFDSWFGGSYEPRLTYVATQDLTEGNTHKATFSVNSFGKYLMYERGEYDLLRTQVYVPPTYTANTATTTYAVENFDEQNPFGSLATLREDAISGSRKETKYGSVGLGYSVDINSDNLILPLIEEAETLIPSTDEFVRTSLTIHEYEVENPELWPTNVVEYEDIHQQQVEALMGVRVSKRTSTSYDPSASYSDTQLSDAPSFMIEWNSIVAPAAQNVRSSSISYYERFPTDIYNTVGKDFEYWSKYCLLEHWREHEAQNMSWEEYLSCDNCVFPTDCYTTVNGDTELNIFPMWDNVLTREEIRDHNGVLVGGSRNVVADKDANLNYVAHRGLTTDVFTLGSDANGQDTEVFMGTTNWLTSNTVFRDGKGNPPNLVVDNTISHYGSSSSSLYTYDPSVTFTDFDDSQVLVSTLKNVNLLQYTGNTRSDVLRGDLSLDGVSPLVSLSEVRKMRYPNGGSPTMETYSLSSAKEVNSLGLTSKTVDANGNVVSYTYDEIGRITRIIEPGDHGDVSTCTSNCEVTQQVALSRDTDLVVYRKHQQCEDGKPFIISDYSNEEFTLSSVSTLDFIMIYREYLTYGDLAVNYDLLGVPRCDCDVSTVEEPKAKQGSGTIMDYDRGGPCNTSQVYAHSIEAFSTVSYDPTLAPNDNMHVYGHKADEIILELEVVPTASSSECINVLVEVFVGSSSKGMEKYVLNCSALGDQLSEFGESVFAIDLTKYKSQLFSGTTPQAFDVEISVETGSAGLRLLEHSPTAMQLRLKGNLGNEVYFDDHTAKYTYDRSGQFNTVETKIDHSENAGVYSFRRTSVNNHLGTNYRTDKVVTHHPDPTNPTKTIAVANVFEYNGMEEVVESTLDLTQMHNEYSDPSHSVVPLLSANSYIVGTEFDAAGRSISTTHEDANQTRTTYTEFDAASSWNTGQDMFGMSSVVETVSPEGRPVAQLFDALGQLRAEYGSTGYQTLQSSPTLYEYDKLGRLTEVTNPNGDLTKYTYDGFGRVVEVEQEDLGVVTYAYDDAGALRFSQDDEQFARDAVTFRQYDDLGRVTIIGEALFTQGQLDDDSGTVISALQKKQGGSSQVSVFGVRATDVLDPNILNIEDPNVVYPPSLTYNPTLYAENTTLITPSLWFMQQAFPTQCIPSIPQEAYTSTPPMHNGQLLMLEIATEQYEPTMTASTYGNFENIQHHPENVRTAVSYDMLPDHAGEIWGSLPPLNLFEQMMPYGEVRNGRGKEVMVAYRQHGGEPFHAVAMSYDERGRVEAIIRFTQNIGFDALYYTYNSSNKVTSVRTVDPLNEHTTWYRYDILGRVKSTYSQLSTNNGCGLGAQVAYVTPGVDDPNKIDIEYIYDLRGKVVSKSYDTDASGDLETGVLYEYNERGWNSRIEAKTNGQETFVHENIFDFDGQITNIRYKHNGAPTYTTNDFTYGDNRQLIAWYDGGGSPAWYAYDNIGNRKHEDANGVNSTYVYGGIGHTNNQLKRIDGVNFEKYFSYDERGSLSLSTHLDFATNETSLEYLHWNYNGQLRKYTKFAEDAPGSTTFHKLVDYRYRYNPAGEREQKRQYYAHNGGTLYRSYYLNNGNQQMAVWEGMEDDKDPSCFYGPGQPQSTVYAWMFPSEYFTYGVGAEQSITTHFDMTGSPVKTFKISDHLGNTRQEIQLGMVIATRDYDPWGNEIASTGNPNMRKSFIDKERDKESNLWDLSARKYDSRIGRFVSIDPMWELYRAWTPYHYSQNNPMSRRDPSGLQDEGVTGPILETTTAQDVVTVTAAAADIGLSMMLGSAGIAMAIAATGPFGVLLGIGIAAYAYGRTAFTAASAIDRVSGGNHDVPSSPIDGVSKAGTDLAGVPEMRQTITIIGEAGLGVTGAASSAYSTIQAVGNGTLAMPVALKATAQLVEPVVTTPALMLAQHYTAPSASNVAATEDSSESAPARKPRELAEAEMP